MGISNIDDVCLSKELSWQIVRLKWAWVCEPTVRVSSSELEKETA